MSKPLLYYLALQGQSLTMDGALAEAPGLAYAFDGPAITSRGVTGGPDGGKGLLFCAGDRSDIAYKPGLQVWRKHHAPGGERELWLGFYRDSPPRPEELARNRMFDGYAVRLADGNKWQVPVARRLDGTTVLPCSLSWDGGKWSASEILPRYKELFSHACRVFEGMMQRTEVAGGKETEITVIMDITEETNIVVSALAANYRVGPDEVSLLGLLDTNSEQDALLAFIDWPALVERAKKKQETGE